MTLAIDKKYGQLYRKSYQNVNLSLHIKNFSHIYEINYTLVDF
jgi:hypothetical protein